MILLNTLSYCVTKKSHNKLLEKLIGMKNNTKMRKTMFFPFCSFARLRIPVMEKKIYVVLSPFLLIGIVQNQTVRSYSLLSP